MFGWPFCELIKQKQGRERSDLHLDLLLLSLSSASLLSSYKYQAVSRVSLNQNAFKKYNFKALQESKVLHLKASTSNNCLSFIFINLMFALI